jgi:Protein of unknown function (DUF3489)
MKMFVIDSLGKIEAIQPDSVTEGQTTFTTERQLAVVTSEWPSGRLAEIWNQLPRVTAVRKFTDRKSAVARIWKAVQALEPAVAPHAAQEPPKKARLGRKAPAQDAAAKANKTATVLGLLRREGGATLEDIMTATGWQVHSVRGFISGVLGKRMGLTVESAKREDGKRVYSLVS